jgi:hypothetical protein
MLYYCITLCTILQDWRKILFNRERESEANTDNKKAEQPTAPPTPTPVAATPATVQQQLLFWLIVSTD